MLKWLQRKAENKRIEQQIYERIVAQARSPVFYAQCDISDTMEGRFEMITLHLCLVLQRLKAEPTIGPSLGRRLIELVIADMDDALRQIGIGDTSVPRRVKKAAAAIGERVRAYAPGLSEDAGLVESTARLQAELLTYVFRREAGHDPVDSRQAAAAHRLAVYARRCVAHLAALPSRDLSAGRITFASTSLAINPGEPT